jgi:hypothetical protein
MTISPEQSRAARGLLDWSQTELGTSANLTAIRAALEAAGVEFIAENGGGTGVRLRKAQPD